ncbi:hypothetical protein [Chitinophaga sp. Cy-1792]|uniref:hypothetical protein n=1 Tax=Chitinophaga sp. Cy-1792 TaxID=2608339 RepID=UPI00141F6005|nr:hypothetical protein [Chitinophaga sp. Cy-1792]NIG54071.1 hypothetical protein [Chitinophaga sp. Cy-1792]
MTKLLQRLLIAFCLLTFAACSSVTPDKFFATTVLNSNLLNDFDPRAFGKILEQYAQPVPNVQKKGNEAEQVVEMKIKYSEKVLEKLKSLAPVDDKERALKENAIGLFETVLPVYKNDYLKYAKLCDQHVTSADKDAILTKIQEQDMPKFTQQMDALFEKGKAFASEHHIEVHWGR